MNVPVADSTPAQPGGGPPGRIDFLYTNIGRGHPFYLDGIVESLPRACIGDVTDVFAATAGLAHLLWQGARLIYQSVGGGGPYSSLYNRLRQRSDYNRQAVLQRTMGRPLRRKHMHDANPLVVAHPVLVAILDGKAALIYQHGEVTAPRETWVRGRHRVLVPLASTADDFIAAGIPSRNVFVSGLCIESALVDQAEEALTARLARVTGHGSLCGAFFTSGAEPRQHVNRLAAAAVSAVSAGGRAIVFARRSGRFAARVVAAFNSAGHRIDPLHSLTELANHEPEALLCLYEDRRRLDAFTVRLFDRFDYFVAPSHERTNWALGLGLPLFIVDPPLGSYAPLNREFLLASSVARVLEDRADVARFGTTVAELRAEGALAKMAEAGWGHFETRGFRNIADYLQAL